MQPAPRERNTRSYVHPITLMAFLETVATCPEAPNVPREVRNENVRRLVSLRRRFYEGGNILREPNYPLDARADGETRWSERERKREGSSWLVATSKESKSCLSFSLVFPRLALISRNNGFRELATGPQRRRRRRREEDEKVGGTGGRTIR